MNIFTIPTLRDNYAYVLVTPDKKVAVIDPGQAAPVREFLRKKKLKLDYILVTHHHGDHTAGVPDLKFEYAAQVIGPGSEIGKIPDIDVGISEGTPLSIGSEPVQIIGTAGHTMGQINFYFPNAAALFSGDTLFTLGCGRVFEGTIRDMYEGLEKLKALPDDTHVYCGHEYTLDNAAFALHLYPDHDGLKDYIAIQRAKRAKNLPTSPTMLGDEKQFNPFLMAKDLAQFRDYRLRKNEFK